MSHWLPRFEGGILIVDDHRLTVRLLLDLLGEAFPGVPLRTAFTAEDAFDSCLEVLPRLVVMDIGLPGENGIDATRRIRALSPDVGVIMHSGYDDGIYRTQALAAGADGFVCKAHAHAELVPLCERLLSTQPAS